MKYNFSCDQCEYVSDRKAFLRRHFKSIHKYYPHVFFNEAENIYFCDLCDYVSKKRGMVIKHTKAVHNLRSEEEEENRNQEQVGFCIH